METTKLSSKGQIIIPKNIRESNSWKIGTEFKIEERDGALILRPVPLFEPTVLEDVRGSLPYDGPAKSLEEMDEAIVREALKHAR